MSLFYKSIEALFRAFGIRPFWKMQPVEIDVAQSHELAAQGKALLVDVREVKEWHATGLPEHAHPVALSDPDMVATVSELSKENPGLPVLISCLSGKRAFKAIDMLAQGGVSDLKLVTGGLQAWLAAGLPVVPHQ